MINIEPEEPSQGIGGTEILYALFRHKWKILFFTAVGIAAAVLVHLWRPTSYESEAKLLVRYVLDRSAIDPVEPHDGAAGFKQNDSVISSEVEILTSWDLAVDTARAVGIERLVPSAPGAESEQLAASVVRSGLTLIARPGSNVIIASYQHADPKLATDVLQEYVRGYFAKHLEVHRSTGAFDFVSNQTEQVRAQLRQTEEQLVEIKAKAGIISIEESTTSLTDQLAKSQAELLAAQAKRAELIARVQEIERHLNGGVPQGDTQLQSVAQGVIANQQTTPGQGSLAEQQAPSGVVLPSSSDRQRYEALHERIAVLRQSELELLSKFTLENELVKVTQAQIQRLDAQRRDLESRFPSLMASTQAKTDTQGAQPPDLVSERAALAAIEAKLQTLQSQVNDAQRAMRSFSELSTQIAELERKKEVAATNAKYFESSLEKARIDEALDPTKMPNISVVQKPSIATPVTARSSKVVLLLGGGGLAFGISLALLIDLVLDRSVKRPSEIETRLGIPLLRTIPFVEKRSRISSQKESGRYLATKADESNGGGDLRNHSSAWETGHFIRPHCDALRDRMLIYFDLNDLKHKPKLLGVIGCSAGAGVSTIAAGLASSLSETGDGKVLLVDMNLQKAEIHPFFDGSPTCPLMDAIRPGNEIVSAADNLYLANMGQVHDGGTKFAAKRFHELLPSMKASDFDYIIFDMPALSRSGAALAIAGLLDKVLLIVEPERVTRDAVRRAYKELNEAKANVAGVVNKAQSYFPKWIAFES